MAQRKPEVLKHRRGRLNTTACRILKGENMMSDAKKEFMQAINELIDEHWIEPEENAVSPERIDNDEFMDWSLSRDGRCVWDGSENNEITPTRRRISEAQARLIINAPDTMRDVIDLVNAYDDEENLNYGGACEHKWLPILVVRLRNRIINAGFGCDLDD